MSELRRARLAWKMQKSRKCGEKLRQTGAKMRFKMAFESHSRVIVFQELQTQDLVKQNMLSPNLVFIIDTTDGGVSGMQSIMS